jgi:NAD(P)-dependent dehydrogenase (short-subunit alcohol dehydrogenase family)
MIRGETLPDREASQRGRVAVVTGASSGIGKAAAIALARMGWSVIGVGRNPERSAEALAEIRRQAPSARVDMLLADIAELKSARGAAEEIAALTDRIDVLLNNAGGIGKRKVLTSEGNEAVFASNHLGHFVLTWELLPLLRKAAKAVPKGDVRIVGVSSLAADFTSGLDWDDLQLLSNYEPNRAYCNAKLANQMFIQELARRLGPEGITANAMHPGVVDTNFSSYGPEENKKAGEEMRRKAVSAEQGADTLVWLATDPTLRNANGQYFYNRQPAAMHPMALDVAAADRLWKKSEAIMARSLGGVRFPRST